MSTITRLLLIGWVILACGCGSDESSSSTSASSRNSRVVMKNDGFTPIGSWRSDVYRTVEHGRNLSFPASESYSLSLQKNAFKLTDDRTTSACNGVEHVMQLQGTRIRTQGRGPCLAREFLILLESDGSLVTFSLRVNSGKIIPYIRWKRS